MPSRDNRLVRAGQIAQAARQAAAIVIALALPRLGVSTEIIGQWEVFVFLAFVLGFGWLTGTLQGFLVRVRAVEPGLVRFFHRLAVGSVGMVSAILLLLVAALHDPFFAFLQLEEPPAWWWFFVFLLSLWPGFLFEQVLVVRTWAGPLVVFGLVSAAGYVLAVLLPIYLGGSLAEAIWWLGLFGALKGLFLLSWLVFDDGIHFRGRPRSATKIKEDSSTASKLLRSWWTASKPLIAYTSVGALVTSFDPWFVNFWYEADERVFALFRYGVREVPFLASLIGGMTAVVIPVIASGQGGVRPAGPPPIDRSRVGLSLLKLQSRKLFHLVFGGTLLLMFTSTWWWTPVFTSAFSESLPIFHAYLLIVGCRLVFAMTVLTALDKTRLLYLSGFVELAVNFALSWWLVQFYGPVGIVWATVVASYLNELFLVLYLRWRTGIKWKEYADVKWYLGYLVLLLLSYLVMTTI